MGVDGLRRGWLSVDGLRRGWLSVVLLLIIRISGWRRGVIAGRRRRRRRGRLRSAAITEQTDCQQGVTYKAKGSWTTRASARSTGRHFKTV